MTLDYKKLAIDFFHAARLSELQGPLYEFTKYFAGKKVPVYAIAEGQACNDCNKFQSLLEYFNIKCNRFLYAGHKLSEFAQKYGLERDLVHNIELEIARKSNEIGVIATGRLLDGHESEFANAAICKILHIGHITLTKNGEFNKFAID